MVWREFTEKNNISGIPLKNTPPCCQIWGNKGVFLDGPKCPKFSGAFGADFLQINFFLLRKNVVFEKRAAGAKIFELFDVRNAIFIRFSMILT